MEYDIEKEKNKMCWMYDGCKCRTAGCYGLPDEGCPVYRWFRAVITYNESKEFRGLCNTCVRKYSCEDAKRHLNVTECSEYSFCG